MQAQYGAAGYLMERASQADRVPANCQAAVYAAHARQPPAVPFSVKEVSRRSTADARGANRGSATKPRSRPLGSACK